MMRNQWCIVISVSCFLISQMAGGTDTPDNPSTTCTIGKNNNGSSVDLAFALKNYAHNSEQKNLVVTTTTTTSEKYRVAHHGSSWEYHKNSKTRVETVEPIFNIGFVPQSLACEGSSIFVKATSEDVDSFGRTKSAMFRIDVVGDGRALKLVKLADNVDGTKSMDHFINQFKSTNISNCPDGYKFVKSNQTFEVVQIKRIKAQFRGGYLDCTNRKTNTDLAKPSDSPGTM